MLLFIVFLFDGPSICSASIYPSLPRFPIFSNYLLVRHLQSTLDCPNFRTKTRLTKPRTIYLILFFFGFIFVLFLFWYFCFPFRNEKLIYKLLTNPIRLESNAGATLSARGSIANWNAIELNETKPKFIWDEHKEYLAVCWVGLKEDLNWGETDSGSYPREWLMLVS